MSTADIQRARNLLTTGKATTDAQVHVLLSIAEMLDESLSILRRLLESQEPKYLTRADPDRISADGA